MKEFLQKLLGGGSEVSSKRVAALFTLLNVIVLTYIATCKSADQITPQFMFNALCWIVAGGLGLTTAEKIFGRKSDDVNTTNQ
ncbi:hypothetical protein EBR43_11160 [bacterium]|nr:hypothetical protein [bacterium]